MLSRPTVSDRNARKEKADKQGPSLEDTREIMSLRSKAGTQTGIGLAAAGVGVAAAATGVVMVLLRRKKGRRPSADAGSRGVALIAGPGLAGSSIGGSF